MLVGFIIKAHSCTKWRKTMPAMHDCACLTMMNNGCASFVHAGDLEHAA